MRHAKSSWDKADQADFERPLNSRGLADAPRIGKLLRREDLIPDQIISSSAVRALTTAELVADECGYEGAIKATRALYHADPETYYEVAAKLPDSVNSLLLVGHNPGIEAFLSKLILTWTTMTTGNIGHVQVDINHWSQFNEGVIGRLVHFWQPKSLFY